MLGETPGFEGTLSDQIGPSNRFGAIYLARDVERLRFAPAFVSAAVMLERPAGTTYASVHIRASIMRTSRIAGVWQKPNGDEGFETLRTYTIPTTGAETIVPLGCSVCTTDGPDGSVYLHYSAFLSVLETTTSPHVITRRGYYFSGAYTQRGSGVDWVEGT